MKYISHKEIFIYFMIGLGIGFAGYILPFFLHLIKVWCLSLSLLRTKVIIRKVNRAGTSRFTEGASPVNIYNVGNAGLKRKSNGV